LGNTWVQQSNRNETNSIATRKAPFYYKTARKTAPEREVGVKEIDRQDLCAGLIKVLR